MIEHQTTISLSVIVPCYNVEEYLDQSLRCLEQQWGARTDYEIILINDGSSDGTINKLNDFKKRHPNHVKIIDKQKNSGPAAARNSAMDIAAGRWIAFFDPDDLLVERSYERLLALAKKSKDVDMIRFGVLTVEEGEEVPSVPVKPLSIDWEGLSQEYMRHNTFGTCWCYLYRHELLEGRRFPQYSIVEDLLFLMPILLEGKKMIKTDAPLYYYLVHTSSATSVIHDPNRLSRQIKDIANAVDVLDGLKHNQPEEIQLRILQKQELLVHNMSNRMILSDLTAKEVNEIVNAMSKLNFFPLPGGGMMVRILNYVFTHLWILPIIRPIYRIYRRICSLCKKNF